ncbi:MAG TPA: chemotaxis protein CheA [Phycisphaerae bacterium]|nr:chemotaxis protein CheA [Phycisphaerae bacterium]
MTLDDLALAVVGIEPGDLQELAHIYGHLESLGTSGELPAAADRILGDAIRCVEQIILENCPDAAQTIAELAAHITALQKLCEYGDPCDAVSPLGGSGGPPSERQPPAGPTKADPAATVADLMTGSGRPQAAGAAGSSRAASDVIAFDPALLAEFVTESLEHLDRAEGILLDLETNPNNPEGVNSIFRAFHTIKGTSGFLGLPRINIVAHKAETLLDRARKGEIALAGGYADLTLASTDLLKQLIEQVRAGLDGTIAPEPEGVDALLDRLDAPDEPLPCESQPMRLGEILVAKGKADREVVETAAETAGKKIGEQLVRQGVVSPRDVVDALRTQKQSGAAAGVGTDATLRVSMARLDRLIDMVGELVIAQAIVSQDPVVRDTDSQALSRKVSQLDKITRELQDLTLSMRMVPLKGMFQKMARLVRDVARKSGKDVRFVTEGDETEIDRNMVDAISDPLVHMMRNAADHGIEPPEERVRAGKSPQGTIALRARHAAGKVIIEVQDDGRGIDSRRILAKAVERGLVEAGRDLPEAEIFDLLFAPGFSTAEKVTDVSGRGVGMDVVKKNIDSLRGRVEITSAKGAGSTFSISLPLTLAIIDGMLLRVGRQTYILPTVTIEQALRPEPGDLSTVKGRGELVMLRGKLIPMFRLHRLFAVPGACENPTEALLVVVEHEAQRIAMLADELLGQQQVVIKSLGSALGEVPVVSGAAILGDGRVGLILDVGGIIRVARGAAEEESA